MSDSTIRSGNPAERPNVEVYRPRKLANVKYIAAANAVKNLDNGDALIVITGHAGGPGRYTYSNEKTGLIAYGGYTTWSDGRRSVYEVLSLLSEHTTGAPHRARSEFNIGCMAELFRARADAALPKHQREILVVDARPATPGDIDPRTGMLRTSKD